MKIQRVSPNIWSLRIWMIIPIHVWVVVEEDGVVLIDAGLGLMAGRIMRFIDGLGVGPLKAILLTHGHSDHTGALQAIAKARQIPVYAHRIELPYMEGKEAYPGRKKAAQSAIPGLARPLPELEGELQPFGSLQPYLTPGHSPGHVAYYHQADDVLIAGDLFTSKNNRLRRPMAMFTADMNEAVRSGAEIISRLQPKRLEVCHGVPIMAPAAQLEAYLAAR